MPLDNRVRLIDAGRQSALPDEVARKLDARMLWLRGQQIALDDELGLPFPRIEVIPAAWRNTLEDGTPGAVPARVSISGEAEDGDDDHVWFVIQASAAALLEFDDDLMLGVLAHEFLHVVQNSLAVWWHVHGGGERTPLQLEPDSYQRSLDDYRRLDSAMQANPDLWLSDRLRRLEAAMGTERNPDVARGLRAITENWIDAGLPAEQVPGTLKGGFIAIDERIIQRARELGVIPPEQNA